MLDGEKSTSAGSSSHVDMPKSSLLVTPQPLLQAPRGRGSETCSLGFQQHLLCNPNPIPHGWKGGRSLQGFGSTRSSKPGGLFPAEGMQGGVQPRGSAPPQGCCSSFCSSTVPKAPNHSFPPAPEAAEAAVLEEGAGAEQIPPSGLLRARVCLPRRSNFLPASPVLVPFLTHYLQQGVIKHTRGCLLLDDEKCSALT